MLGGSTAAALMRAERTVRAGVDPDGSVNDAAARRGVRGAFLALPPSTPSTIRARRGRSSTRRGLARKVAGLAHDSFSDLSVVAPEIETVPPARAIALPTSQPRRWRRPATRSGHAQRPRWLVGRLREREVLAVIADRTRNRDMASVLQLSPRTAKAHVAHTTRKLQASTRVAVSRIWTLPARGHRSRPVVRGPPNGLVQIGPPR